jgi:hypothetical protein
MLRRAPFGTVSELLHSIRHYDHNNLPAIPFAGLMLILREISSQTGDQRTVELPSETKT